MTSVVGTLFDRVERALPREVSARLALARRDAAMLLDGLAGRQPPPVVRRRAPPALASAARSVRVREVIRETPDAVSLVLVDAAGGAFRYEAGQFFTVCATVGGAALRRAYSASAPCGEGDGLRITVKRVPGGAMSTHLTERVRAGDRLELLGPHGSVVARATPRARHAVLVGGGSGITPLYALARAILRDEPASRVSLVYGNRAWGDVIFRDALDALAREHPARFAVRHVLQRAHEGFDGAVGLLDEAAASRELDALDPAGDAAREYFVCGPEPMRVAVRNALRARGVDPAAVREEVYTSPRAPASTGASVAQRVTLRVRGVERDVLVRGSETILEAASREGVAMPSSCTVGGCGACRCVRVAGEVVMDEPNCLRDDERAAGAVLTCVGRPRGHVVLEVP